MVTTRSAAPQLLPELTDMILDYLHHDRKSLGVCGLVCRSWLPTARYHLLAGVEITIGLVCDFRDGGNAFLQLLRSPWCTIHRQVRHVRIRGTCNNGLVSRRSPISNALILQLPAFVGVKTLHLEEIAWELTPRETRRSLLSSFPHLESLTLSRVHFPCFEDALAVICAYPALTSLSLCEGVQWANDILLYSTTTTQHRPPAHLRHVSLDGLCGESLISALLSQTPDPPIERLDLQSITPQKRACIDKILRSAGPALKHLTLDFARPGQVHAAEGLDLRHNGELRALCFEQVLMYTAYASDDPCEAARQVLGILSSVSSPHVDAVAFGLWVLNSIDELDTFDWAAADGILARPVFSGVRTVLFRLYGVPRFPPVRLEELAKKRLPRCAARGLVRFDVVHTARKRTLPRGGAGARS